MTARTTVTWAEEHCGPQLFWKFD